MENREQVEAQVLEEFTKQWCAAWKVLPGTVSKTIALDTDGRLCAILSADLQVPITSVTTKLVFAREEEDPEPPPWR